MSAGELRAPFHMVDVRHQRMTARRAVAVGELSAGPDAYPLIVQRRLPGGDAMSMAEVAGMQGAKTASQLLPLCHPLPLEHIGVRCQAVDERHVIRVYCEVCACARSGVEMQALAGASAALLALYDLTKPVEPALTIGGVRLLLTEGGKTGLWQHPDGMSEDERERYRPRTPARLDDIPAAIITLSDHAQRGDHEALAALALVERLRALGARVGNAEVSADDPGSLAARLHQLSSVGTRLVLCTGGTGPGARDCTSEALAIAADRYVHGLGELFRSQGSQHATLAWLNGAEAVLMGAMLVIALPGSPRAVAQDMDILAPLLAHALKMVAGGNHVMSEPGATPHMT